MRTLIASSAVIAVILTALPSSAVAQAPRDQAPQGRFCLRLGSDGQARCGYRTLARCEHARTRGSTGRCFDRTYMVAATPPADTAAPPQRSPRRAAKPGW